MVMGTADYLSPEQGRGTEVDARSDLYSVGVLAYEMLGGQLPFESDSATGMIYQHVYEEPGRLDELVPGLPAQLVKVVHQLLEKSAEQRPQTAHEVLGELSHVSNQATADDKSSPPGRRSATEIIARPEFQAGPQLPAELDAQAPLTWRQQAYNLLWQLYRRRAPDFIRQLENTQFQVGGAVAEYERRHEQLDSLVRQAEHALAELNRQADSHREAQAAAESGEVISLASGTNQRLATELDEQIAVQTEELDSMRVHLAQTRATLHRLRAQRDVLVARLKVAHAQGGSHAPGSGWLTATWLKIAAVVGVLIAVSVLGWSLISPGQVATVNRTIPADSSSIVDSTGAGPSDPYYQPGVFSHAKWRFGQKGPLGELIIPFPHTVSCLAFEPNARQNRTYSFAVGDERGVITRYLFGANGFVGKTRLVGQHRQRVSSIDCSPDGLLASAAGDETVRLWRYSRGEYSMRPLKGGNKAVRLVAFSPDGSRIMSATHDQMLCVWNAETGEQESRHRLTGRGDPLTLAWFLDSDDVLVGTSQQLGRLNPMGRTPQFLGYEVSQESTLAASVSPHGTSAYSLTGGSICEWNLEAGQLVRRFGQGLTGCAFSPFTRRIWAVSGSQLQLWDADSGTVTKSYDGHSAPISCVAISPDGSRAVSASADETVRFWKLPDPPPPVGQALVFTDEAAVNSVAFSPDGHLAACANDSGATIWDLNLGRKVHWFFLRVPISAVVFSPNGERLVYATAEPKEQQYHLSMVTTTRTGRALQYFDETVLVRFDGPQAPVRSVYYTPDGRSVVAADETGTVWIWNASTGDVVSTFKVGAPANSLAVSWDTDRLLLGTSQKSILVWDLQQEQETAQLPGHTFLVHSVAVTSDGRRAVSGSADRSVRVWDLDSGDEIVVLNGHNGRVRTVAMTQDGYFVLSGSDDGTVRYWSVVDGQEVARFVGHNGPVNSVKISPDGRLGMSGGADQTIRFWQLP